MGLFSKTTGTAEAVHARVSDGEHLWLAVRGAESLVLTGAPISDLTVPTEIEDDVLTAVFPLAAALASVEGDVELRLCHGPRATAVVSALVGRPDSPTLPAPTTRDGRWQLSVQTVDDGVVLRRTRVVPTVPVLGLAAVEDGVRLRLGHDPARATVTVGDTSWPVTDGHAILGTLPGLAAGTQTPVLVDGLPAVRARNVLTRPHFAVTLPPMLEPDVELRWLKDGRLVATRREEQP